MGNISPLQRGFDLPKQSIVAGNIPIVYSNGILKFHNQSKSKAPGLVTGRSGTIGKFTFIENGEYWPHNTSLWVTDFCGNIPKFIYYLYQTINIEQFSTGSGVPTLNRNDVHRKKCSIPNIEEQKKISSFLSLLDEKLQTQRKIIEELNVFKKGIAKKIFSQQLRFKDDNGDYFPEWKEIDLGNVCEIKKGEQFNKEELDETGLYPYLNGGISPSGFSEKYNTDENTITISEGGNSCGFVNFMTTKFWLGGHCYKILLSQNINLLYFYQLLKYNEQKIMSLRVGSGLPNIQLKDLKRLKIEISLAENEQQKIANFLSSIDTKIDIENQILQKLEEQKKYFLANLFI